MEDVGVLLTRSKALMSITLWCLPHLTDSWLRSEPRLICDWYIDRSKCKGIATRGSVAVDVTVKILTGKSLSARVRTLKVTELFSGMVVYSLSGNQHQTDRQVYYLKDVRGMRALWTKKWEETVSRWTELWTKRRNCEPLSWTCCEGLWNGCWWLAALLVGFGVHRAHSQALLFCPSCCLEGISISHCHVFPCSPKLSPGYNERLLLYYTCCRVG